MRLTIPKLRMWHLLGLVAASAAYIATFQFRWTVEDPGYALIRRLRSLDAAERAKAAGGLMWHRPRERRAIAPLTEMLFDPDPRARAAAADALTTIIDHKDESEVGQLRAALTSALGDPDPIARLEIATSLCGLDPEPRVIVPTLLEFARDRDPATRVKAIWSLSLFGRRSEPALAALFTAIGDADLEVRVWAVEALGSCADRPNHVAPEPILGRIKVALLAAADDEQPRVRATAVRGLATLASRAKVDHPRVIEALSDSSSWVRNAAANYLSWNRPGKRSKDLIPALVRTLADADQEVRRMSAMTLGTLGFEGEAALPALRASTHDPEQVVRDAATRAVEAIEEVARTLRTVTLPGAIGELGDPDAIVRALAAGRLGDLGPRASGAVPALVALLGDGEAEVRRASAIALGQIGPGADVAIPALAKLAESDPDERVRRASTFARSILARESNGGIHAP